MQHNTDTHTGKKEAYFCAEKHSHANTNTASFTLFRTHTLALGQTLSLFLSLGLLLLANSASVVVPSLDALINGMALQGYTK